MNIDDLYDRRLEFPDSDINERYSRLVGLDAQKDTLEKILGLLIEPSAIKDWQEKYHPDADLLVDTVLRRPPLVILAGDVGTGKTELGETVGDAVARRFDIPIMLYPLSLSTRGTGKVGEMTKLLSDAFDVVYDEASRLKRKTKSAGGVILLVDEADALAQSRENAQMHHEDRAGVNALLRGIDRLADATLPAVVLMCTNRLNALDPAVRRRACEVFNFRRPDKIQREALLRSRLAGADIQDAEIKLLVDATGSTAEREYGFTYSDLTQRLLPGIILACFPNHPITADSLAATVAHINPTPPFNEPANG